jgi:YggT family protein
MQVILVPLLKVLLVILNVYSWMLIVYAIISWLYAFGVINPQSQVMYFVQDFLRRLIEPALRPLRRIIPLISGIDLSLLALFFIIYFVESMITQVLVRWVL